MAQQGVASRRCARSLVSVGLVVFAAMLIGSAVAQPTAPAEAGVQATQVFTRARVVSVQQGSGSKLYVRLKLLPKSKLPFTTQSFRVVDRALLAGISEGAWVKFSARHADGENTLTAIHVVEECQRFQHCD